MATSKVAAEIAQSASISLPTFAIFFIARDRCQDRGEREHHAEGAESGREKEEIRDYH